MVINNVIECVHSLNYKVLGLTYSSIKGPKGNIEYLIWISTSDCEEIEYDTKNVVETAHNNLN